MFFVTTFFAMAFEQVGLFSTPVWIFRQGFLNFTSCANFSHLLRGGITSSICFILSSQKLTFPCAPLTWVAAFASSLYGRKHSLSHGWLGVVARGIYGGFSFHVIVQLCAALFLRWS
jgi:hypothetical protein